MADVPGIPKPDTELLAGCRERGKSQVFYIMRSFASFLLGPSECRGRWVGPPFPEALRIRKDACVSDGQSGAPAEAFSRSGRFISRIHGFPPGVVRPQPRDDLLPRCAVVPGMEKKLGSEPKRNGKQPPSSLPCPPSVWVAAETPERFCIQPRRRRPAVGREAETEDSGDPSG